MAVSPRRCTKVPWRQQQAQQGVGGWTQETSMLGTPEGLRAQENSVSALDSTAFLSIRLCLCEAGFVKLLG